MRPGKPNGRDSIVPGILPVAAVAVSLIAAARFIPSEGELLDRFRADKDGQRIQELGDAKAAEKGATTLTAPQTDAEKFQHWLTAEDATLRSDVTILAAQTALCSATETPGLLGTHLAQAAGSLSPELHTQLANALATRAVGLNRNDEAGAVLSTLLRRAPSWELAQRCSAAWMRAGLPVRALEEMEFAATTLPESSQPADLADQRLTLAIHAGRDELAFDLLADRYTAAGHDRAAQAELLGRMMEFAGDRPAEAAEILSSFLNGVSFHTAPLAEAARMVREGKGPSGPERAAYIKFTAMLAQGREWSDQSLLAFDPWARLALLGDPRGWDRVDALCEDLLREEDLTLILRERLRRGECPQLHGLMGSLCASQGLHAEALEHFAAAKKLLREAEKLPLHLRLSKMTGLSADWLRGVDQWLGLNPTAALAGIAAEETALFGEMEAWDRQLAAAEEWMRLAPDSTEALRARSFARVRLGKYEDGATDMLELSRRLKDDPALQETCAALCSSLGRFADAVEALQRCLACPGYTPLPDEYLELASAQRMLGREADGEATLRTGLKSYAVSPKIRLTLAEMLAARGEPQECMQLLAHESLRDSASGAAMLIDVAMASPSHGAALAYFGEKSPRCLQPLPLARLRLAFLYERSGQMQAAEAILAELKSNPAYATSTVWQEIARVSLELGDSVRAEEFARLHLAHSGSRDSRTWSILGDIYEAQNRQADADAAYRKALEFVGPSSRVARN